ncbi:MAG: 4-hydroxy-tetrahydrodipicolinate reductase [Clostridiales bacterium]|nr:4-hydroxy-tetrahydrodipicolinate reductase [Clostridiales bacterium]
MKNIIISGSSGRMGRFVSSAILSDPECETICGIDKYIPDNSGFPVFASALDIPDEISKKADCMIDFSNPECFDTNIKYCLNSNIGIVVATTGLSDEQKQALADASEKIPVFFSANMSLGVNLITELAKTATKVLGSGFDIEVVEMHHNQKLDAPSGTALMIADEIKSVRNSETYYEYDRHIKREKRNANEIGIHSLRGGTVTGEHQIIFAGNDEIVTISHSARSRGLFATGAVNAAKFIMKKQNGMFNMKDMIEE